MFGRIYAETSDHTDKLAQARSLAKDGNYDDAITLLREIAELSGDNPWIAAYLADATSYVDTARRFDRDEWVNVVPQPGLTDWRHSGGDVWIDATGAIAATLAEDDRAEIELRDVIGGNVVVQAELTVEHDEEVTCQTGLRLRSGYGDYHDLLIDTRSRTARLARSGEGVWLSKAVEDPTALTLTFQSINNRLTVGVGDDVLCRNQLSDFPEIGPQTRLALVVFDRQGQGQVVCRFRNIRYQRLPASPPTTDGAPAAKPVPVELPGNPAIADAADATFEDTCPQPGYLVGFRLVLEPRDRGPRVVGLTPIYRTPLGLRPGRRVGREIGPTVHVLARRGYAVAGLMTSAGATVEGVRVVFARIDPAGNASAKPGFPG